MATGDNISLLQMVTEIYLSDTWIAYRNESRKKFPVVDWYRGVKAASNAGQLPQAHNYKLGLNVRAATGKQLGMVAEEIPAFRTSPKHLTYRTFGDAYQYSHSIDLREQLVALAGGGAEAKMLRFQEYTMDKKLQLEHDMDSDLMQQFYYGTHSRNRVSGSGTDILAGQFCLIGGVASTDIDYLPAHSDGVNQMNGLFRFENPTAQASAGASAAFQGLARSNVESTATYQYWHNQFVDAAGWAHAQRLIDNVLVTMRGRNQTVKYGNVPTMGLCDPTTFQNIATSLNSRLEITEASKAYKDGSIQNALPLGSETLKFRGITIAADDDLDVSSVDTALGGAVPGVLAGVLYLINEKAFERMDCKELLLPEFRKNDFYAASDPNLPGFVSYATQKAEQLICHDLFSQCVVVGAGVGA